MDGTATQTMKTMVSLGESGIVAGGTSYREARADFYGSFLKSTSAIAHRSARTGEI